MAAVAVGDRLEKDGGRASDSVFLSSLNRIRWITVFGGLLLVTGF
jgi:hypothetical protein